MAGPKTSDELKLMKITIERIRVQTDPKIDIFEVTLSTNGEWKETYGSEAELRAFLRGVKAGAFEAGWVRFEEPEIPREPTKHFDRAREDHRGGPYGPR